MPKNGFFVYFDKYLPLKNLTYEQKGKILEASYCYNAGEEYAFDDPVCELAFSYLKQGYDFFNERAEAKSGKYKESGKLGGLAKARNAKERLAMASNASEDVANASDAKQSLANCSKNKNKNNIYNTPLTPQGGESELNGTKKRSNRNAEYSQDFLDFWAIYPRKDNKRGAWKAYLKAQNEGRLPDDLLERLRNKCLCDQWSKDGGQYIPYAERWLNKDGWEDADCEIESYAAGWEEELAKLGEIYRRCEVGIFDSEEERARKNEIYKNEYEPMLDDLHRRGCRAI